MPSHELETGDTDSFLTRLRAFFADFPYELNREKENNYQIVFYLSLIHILSSSNAP